jgi:putative transposase
MKQGVGYKQLRKNRFSEAGQYYHVTFTVHKRLPVFLDFKAARQLISVLHQPSISSRCDTLAFVVMPDHVHWLLALKSNSLPDLVQRVKSFFTKEYGQSIWQPGFYDHTIRSDKELVNVARYIVANPLRAGLVKHVGDYSHWDSVWLGL